MSTVDAVGWHGPFWLSPAPATAPQCSVVYAFAPGWSVMSDFGLFCVRTTLDGAPCSWIPGKPSIVHACWLLFVNTRFTLRLPAPASTCPNCAASWLMRHVVGWKGFVVVLVVVVGPVVV